MRLNYFNFKALHGQILLTNDCGDYVFVNENDFKRLLSGQIDPESAVGKEFKEAGIIYEVPDLVFSENMQNRLRNIKGHLASATSLHIFVITTACNLNCVYCQATNGKKSSNTYMTEETAEKAVDIALQSPETYLSFEFQGGEPLLNFPVIRHIVEYTEKKNTNHKIEYNIVSNLQMLNESMIDFFKQHNIDVSTSVDGGSIIHDANRPTKDGKGSYVGVAAAIKELRKNGIRVGAIETTTRASLENPGEIVNAYLELGLDSIFLRPLTQLGKAGQGWEQIGYTAEEFIIFYRRILDELIRINKDGRYIQEQHASIFLKRIKGRRMNYMELRSPCGGGIGQLAYYTDGDVYTCDEGRMLAEMGIDQFKLGNVNSSDYNSLVENRVCHAVCSSSTLETIPSCCDCVYQPYCGVCPVVNYANTQDIIEKHPRMFRCRVYSGILDYLFELILNKEDDTIRVLDSWSE